MLEYQKAVGRYLKKPHQNRFLNKKLKYTPSKKNMETQVKTRNVLTPKFGSESPNLEILRCPGHSHHRRASAACTFGGPIFGGRGWSLITAYLWFFGISNEQLVFQISCMLLLPEVWNWDFFYLFAFFCFSVLLKFKGCKWTKITNRTSKSLRVSKNCGEKLLDAAIAAIRIPEFTNLTVLFIISAIRNSFPRAAANKARPSATWYLRILSRWSTVDGWNPVVFCCSLLASLLHRVFVSDPR